MKFSKFILLTALLFLWISFIIQFFTISFFDLQPWFGLSSASLASITAFYWLKDERFHFSYRYWYLLLPLLPPIIWQAWRVLYIQDAAVYVWNYNNLGDMPYHLGLANFLQYHRFWPENYIFSSDILKYPFAVDYLHTLLQSFFSDLVIYPLLTVFFLSLAIWTALQMGGVAFVYLLFCNGTWFWTLSQEQVSWKNLFLSVLIPQRGYLLALPIGLMLLDRWWKYYKDGLHFSCKEIYMYSFLFGSLAWVHMHTYVFFAIFSVCLFLFKPNKKWFYCLLLAVGIGFPFVWISTQGLQAVSQLRFLVVWDKIATEPGISFLFKNFNVLLLLPLLLPWFSRKEVKVWLGLQVFLGSLFLFLMFSAWPWDNIKFLLWVYIAFGFVFLQVLPRLSLKIFFVILLCVPGLVTIWNYSFVKNNPQQIFSLSEVSKYKDWMAKEHRKETYIIFPTYNHPIFMYGVKVVMGYEGHLWSHGLNYVSLQEELRQALKGSVLDLQAFAQKYQAKYLVYSEIEKKQFGLLPALASLPVVYTYEDLVIYEMY